MTCENDGAGGLAEDGYGLGSGKDRSEYTDGEGGVSLGRRGRCGGGPRGIGGTGGLAGAR